MKLQQLITEQTSQLDPNTFKHLLTPATVALHKAMGDAGYELRIVGGAVRDLALGLDPKDIDMATTATPDQMVKVFEEHNFRYEPTGLQHGTLTVVLDGEPIEITTLRIDTNQDGRHAEVVFTDDWKKDAERRDLTFNAMSMGLDGTLYDYFGGLEDLQNGVARFVGDADQRMQEDYLRIMRYFRFQGRLSQTSWDKETMDAIKRNADGLKQISGERIWMELSKILSRPSRVEVIKKMNDAGVLDAINLPSNRLNYLKQAQGSEPAAVLASMLNTVGGLNALRNKWKLPNSVVFMASFIIETRNENLTDDQLKVMMTRPEYSVDYIFAMLESTGQSHRIRKLAAFVPPTFPITGKDLIAAGLKPGPEMGEVLAQLRDYWEQSSFKLSKDELLSQLT